MDSTKFEGEAPGSIDPCRARLSIRLSSIDVFLARRSTDALGDDESFFLPPRQPLDVLFGSTIRRWCRHVHAVGDSSEGRLRRARPSVGMPPARPTLPRRRSRMSRAASTWRNQAVNHGDRAERIRRRALGNRTGSLCRDTVEELVAVAPPGPWPCRGAISALTSRAGGRPACRCRPRSRWKLRPAALVPLHENGFLVPAMMSAGRAG